MLPTDRPVEVGEITLHTYELGQGPGVLFLHGFPELAFSWRHQLAPVAEAGYRAIACDLRGYGKSSKPEPVEAYALMSLVEDIVGLCAALDLDRPVFVGHDWGSIVMWSVAVTHPDRVGALVSLNVPYRGWCCGFPNTQFIEKNLADRFSYVLSFQRLGDPERTFGQDPAAWLRRVFNGVARRPDFMSPDEFSVYLDAFQEGGISGPINYYRNIDRNWEDTSRLAHRPIEAPTLMIAADSDPVLPLSLTEGMDRWVPQLSVEVVHDCGHWTQQEQPQRVTDLLVEFLASL